MTTTQEHSVWVVYTEVEYIGHPFGPWRKITRCPYEGWTVVELLDPALKISEA